MFNYECVGQLSLLDFIDITKINTSNTARTICKDEKINQLVNDISFEMNKILPKFPKVKRESVEYSVWEHVENLGLRLWYSYSFECQYLTDPDKWCGIGANRIAELIPIELLAKKADQIGLELSIMQTPSSIAFTTIEKKHKSKCKEIEED